LETVISPPRPVSAAPANIETEAVTSIAAPREVLSFRLGAEEYGIDILCVQEIRSYELPTRIANAPPHVRGVVNLRGVIVPIVDLRLKLGLAEAPCDATTATVVLTLGARTVGVVVDSVSDVIELDAAAIKPPPQLAAGAIDDAFLNGIATLPAAGAQRERLLILVDIARLMGAELA
jgi:purine-binding chemotaxis protein CheW